MNRTKNIFGVVACMATLALLGACSSTSGGANAGELGSEGSSCSEKGASCSEGGSSCGEKGEKKAAGNLGVVSEKAPKAGSCSTSTSCADKCEKKNN